MFPFLLFPSADLGLEGGPLQKVDNTLTPSHTRRPYRNLPREPRIPLMQLCAGHNWLSSYYNKLASVMRTSAYAAHKKRSPMCLWTTRLPRLRELQKKLRKEFRDVFNTVSSLLGDSRQGKRVKPDNILASQDGQCRASSPRSQKDFVATRYEGSLTVETAIRSR